MRNKIFIFVDVVAKKNQLQAEAITSAGLAPHFFVTRCNPGAESFLGVDGKQELLATGFLTRLKQVRSQFKKNKDSIHHIEVYPGGRFSFLYVLLAKQYHVPVICVERGDLLYYHSQGYPKAVRFSMWFCYRFADVVWYREPYMKPLLEKLNRNLFFLHNAIKRIVNVNTPSTDTKDITFLWLNRVIPERRYDWFLEVLAHPDLACTQNYLVGITPDSGYLKEQQYVLNNKPGNLAVADYTDAPQQFYKRAKYFVLPANVVFANHAVLEAMQAGVVPLLSDQPGTSLIAENGKEGFVFNHTKGDLEAAMLKAFHMDEAQLQRMSAAAMAKIKNDFSEEKYTEAIKKLYERFDIKPRLK